MHNVCNKEVEKGSLHSATNCLNSCPSWWNSGGSHILQLSFSNARRQSSNQLARLGCQLPDQDSSSTQSTGQSHQKVMGSVGDDPRDQCVPVQSGNWGNDEKQVEAPKKPVLSLGESEVVLPLVKVDYSQSIQACVPYHYADPFYGGVLTAYGSHAFIHPQIVGTTAATRVPLPLEPAADEPIYVNAKQYNGILRRRQLRARQEAENKLIKARKPYLHESRHRHAMNRERGSGGRFLNTKNLEQEAKQATTADDQTISRSHLQLGGRGKNFLRSGILCSKSGRTRASTTSTCSEVTTISNSGDIFQNQNHPSFTDFHSHGESGARSSGMILNGSQPRVPVMK